jgi:glycerol-3-phosphate dehydrogenase
LALNGVSVWIVDTADIATGATSGSSRLVHGGLRYLEYGEFDLVKESLAERARLVRLAPQYVRPLRLWVPAETRFGGLTAAVGKFFGWRFWPQPVPKRGRGVALVRAGLAFYDAYAQDPDWPRYQAVSASAPDAPPVDRAKYRWLCSYFDAQVAFPERLTVALLEDARAISERHGLDFRVLTYRASTLRGRTVEINPSQERNGKTETLAIEPAMIVNATGAWVDDTLRRLHVPAERLMGGTKGSHLFTFHGGLRAALGGDGVYAEAGDGRPIFITPLDHAVLVGTTDVRFDGPPETALATRGELDYLLGTVRGIFPDVKLEESDVAFHYSAVRPLPFVSAASTAAITRRHALVKHGSAQVPIISVVGGKLTTMRSLAEITAAAVLEQLGREATVNSQNRYILGGEDYPREESLLQKTWQNLGGELGYQTGPVEAAWRLVGTRAPVCLSADTDRQSLDGGDMPRAMARWAIEREWATTLADLVERRLMLLYDQRLTRACLAQLAQLLAAAGHLADGQVETAVAGEVERLAARYGKRVD